MSEKQLMRFRVAEFLAHLTRDGGLERHCHEQRTDPQWQDRVERCHLRTEILDWEHRVAFHFYRGCKRGGQRVGIIAEHIFDGAHIAAVQRIGQCSCECAQFFARAGQTIGGGIQHAADGGQILIRGLGGAVQIAQRAFQIGRCGIERGGGAGNGRGDIVKLRFQLALIVGFDATDGRCRLLRQFLDLRTFGRGIAYFGVDVVGAAIQRRC